GRIGIFSGSPLVRFGGCVAFGGLAAGDRVALAIQRVGFVHHVIAVGFYGADLVPGAVRTRSTRAETGSRSINRAGRVGVSNNGSGRTDALCLWLVNRPGDHLRAADRGATARGARIDRAGSVLRPDGAVD